MSHILDTNFNRITAVTEKTQCCNAKSYRFLRSFIIKLNTFHCTQVHSVEWVSESIINCITGHTQEHNSRQPKASLSLFFCTHPYWRISAYRIIGAYVEHSTKCSWILHSQLILTMRCITSTYPICSPWIIDPHKTRFMVSSPVTTSRIQYDTQHISLHMFRSFKLVSILCPWFWGHIRSRLQLIIGIKGYSWFLSFQTASSSYTKLLFEL